MYTVEIQVPYDDVHSSLDLEAQYTINPSRAAEITIADTIPGKVLSV